MAPLFFARGAQRRRVDEAVHFTDEDRVQNLILRVWMNKEMNSPVETTSFKKGRIGRLGERKMFSERLAHSYCSAVSSAGRAEYFFTIERNLPIVIRNDHKPS